MDNTATAAGSPSVDKTATPATPVSTPNPINPVQAVPSVRPAEEVKLEVPAGIGLSTPHPSPLPPPVGRGERESDTQVKTQPATAQDTTPHPDLLPNGEKGVDEATVIPNSKGSGFNVDDALGKLDAAINNASLPPDLHDKVIAMSNRLKIIKGDSGFFLEFDSISRYIEWITNLPWNHASEDILDLNHAKQVFDKNHYGLNDVKEKIMEYLAIMIRKKQKNMGAEAFARAPIISLVGLVGVGKTTIAYSIAEALGRKIARIPFGGMGSASQLRGKTRLFPDAEPGLIIKALRNVGTNNPVILLDEVDRVSAEARADIMGVLVELLDPTQNKAFTDHFIDFPFNLQNVLFVATSNNTKDISTAVLDRLEIIQMPSYTDVEKITIAKTYMFPKVMVESGMSNSDIVIDDGVWEAIVRPLGYDSGIRSLERIIQGVVRKVVYFQQLGKIPQGQFRITAENVKDYVPAW